MYTCVYESGKHAAEGAPSQQDIFVQARCLTDFWVCTKMSCSLTARPSSSRHVQERWALCGFCLKMFPSAQTRLTTQIYYAGSVCLIVSACSAAGEFPARKRRGSSRARFRLAVEGGGAHATLVGALGSFWTASATRPHRKHLNLPLLGMAASR